jgi:hypothetical protein
MDTPLPILLLSSTCKKTDDVDTKNDKTSAAAGVEDVPSSGSDFDGKTSVQSFDHDGRGGHDMLNPPPCLNDDSALGSDKQQFGPVALTDLPITCDIILMPEHHQGPSTPLQVLHVPRITMNPCGMSNVLVLENLPWSLGINIEQQTKNSTTVLDSQLLPTTTAMLMSLTSCSIPYSRSLAPPLPPPSASTSTTSDHRLLPIDPIPSTFVITLDWLDNKDNSSSDSYSNTIVGELSVEFDFTEASRQAHELRMMMVFSTTSSDVQEASDKNLSHASGDESHKADDIATDHRNADYLQKNSTVSNNDHNASFQSNQSSLRQHSASAIVSDEQYARADTVTDQCPFQPSHVTSAFQTPTPTFQRNVGPMTNGIDARRTLLIEHLQTRLEHEAHLLEQTLYGLAYLGLILTGFLFWAIYQYYQSSVKSDTQTRKICESMQQTRNVLQDAVSLLSEKETLARKQKERNADDDDGYEGGLRKIYTPSTPPTRTSQVMDQLQATLKCTSPVPPSTAPPLPSSTGTGTLSPCSLFAKEWYERRTVRRSNRTKRRPYVKPISSPQTSKLGDENRSNGTDELQRNIADLSLPSSSSSTSSSSSSLGRSSNDRTKIMDPPNLLGPVFTMNRCSNVIDHPIIDCDVTSEEGDIVGRNRRSPVVVPPSTMTNAIVAHHILLPSSPSWPPLLCSTPASDDGSFVDDYW